MNRQVTNTILMVRPRHFYGNEQTAVNNHFQQLAGAQNQQEIQEEALKEFDLFVEKLDLKGIDVLVDEDTETPKTPDAIFPNNWISFHESGKVFTYPMFAENRRLERKEALITQIGQTFDIQSVVGLESWENDGCFLEGTGSLVLDRESKLAYVALSDRAHLAVIRQFEELSGYQAIIFHANLSVDGKRMPIYHTNVMMYVGEEFAVVGLDSIDDAGERNTIAKKLNEAGKKIIPITEKQVAGFAGNGLQVCTKKGDRYIVMSTTAFRSLDQNQQKALEKNGEIIHSPVNTIEHYGGGSARCMMAEIFLSRKHHV